MNPQAEKAIRQRIAKLTENESNTQYYRNRLSEKGVECAILMPLLEHVLDFDPLDDIEYEITSREKFGQRFDFLLDSRFIIEAKSPSSLLDSKTLQQSVEYISGNQDINYGVFTNGWSYIFLIQRTFIEKIANNGNELIGLPKQVYEVLKLDLNDPNFMDIFTLFSKTSYDETFRSIARYVYRMFVPTKGPMPVIVSDKILDEYIKKLISEKINFKKGYYLRDIQKGKVNPGDRFAYDDGNVRIEIVVQADGRVLLPKEGVKIKDLQKLVDNGEFPKLIEKFRSWYTEDQKYDDPKQILWEATGKHHLVGKKYKFYPV